MALETKWVKDGMTASLRDEDDELWARLRLVDDWYAPGTRLPMRAWVVEWLDATGERPQMVRASLEASPQPAEDEETMVRLSETAAVIARASAPADPAAFGHALTGLVDAAEVFERIQLLSHAVQEAQGRLNDAANVLEAWGSQAVLIALTETVSWLRALDDAMNHVWRGLSEASRNQIALRIDEALIRPGWDPDFAAWAKAQRGSDGYADWTLGLLPNGTGLSREDLRGIRWLAGKLLHFGPLPAAELRQWREGERPRWRWRASAAIFPTRGAERRSHDRVAYDDVLAGRDVIGSLNLFDALHATESLAWELMGRPSV